MSTATKTNGNRGSTMTGKDTRAREAAAQPLAPLITGQKKRRLLKAMKTWTQHNGPLLELLAEQANLAGIAIQETCPELVPFLQAAGIEMHVEPRSEEAE